MIAAQRFIVRSSVGEASWSRSWDASTSLELAHAIRCRLERVADRILVRLGSKTVGEFPLELNEAKSVEIPLAEGHTLSIEIAPARAVAPAFASAAAESAAQQMRAYSCRGEWVLGVEPIIGTYRGMADGRHLFTLSRASAGYSLRPAVAGVACDGGEVAVQQELALKPEQLEAAVISCEGLSWRFRGSAISPAPAEDLVPDAAEPEAEWFRKALRYSLVALGAFCVLTWVWPKPKPATEAEELVPPQFAKIVMSRSKAASSPAAGSAAQASTKGAEAAKTSVEKSAVVQAFRAKALKNAVSGLLKGGMTTLLAQSDFVSGTQAAASARRIFEGGADALAPSAPLAGQGGGRQVAVASVGGGGQGGKGGVGYGKGERAGVQGQGQSFVSMDTSGSTVDEGLTKDEVGEVIHRHLSEVRYCYESAMIRTPDIEGKLMVGFTIGGAGAVKSTAVRDSTLQDPRLDDCILRRLMTWKFPQPRGGIDVAVSYPFIFKTLGR